MEHLHEKRRSIDSIFKELHATFGENISNLDRVCIEKLEFADLQSRAIYECRDKITNAYCGNEPHRAQCASILPEVFADFSISAYLISCGLTVPARMSCRRALEGGLAAIYMWDLPHEFWKWKRLDGDLSFSAMIEHLASNGFGAHVAAVKGLSEAEEYIDSSDFKKLYRKLSNTVHGKNEDLAPLEPGRYAPDSATIEKELILLIDAERLVLMALRKRFPLVDEYLNQQFPRLPKT
ncbi:hypothetical protein [Methylocystis sp.]|uniref:hypothetical protein n=1 Tax=Methylocystis sp. TaxID=1911079 RepID=UPI003DA49FF6